MIRDIFKMHEPSDSHLDDFERDGYIAFPNVMRDSARESLIEEVLTWAPISEFLALSNKERVRRERPATFFARPWNDRGPWSDALIDAPLIAALLQRTMGPDFHFCHSAINVALRGAERSPFHQDHHHWKHNHPVNLAEREKAYIQVLYYPNGFTRGDRSLAVIPGSHRVAPTEEVTPERLLAGDFDDEAGHRLEAVHLELPPGSFIYLNARMFHGVEPKPMDAAREFRLFLIDIFKEAGPPHRFTQEVPRAWIEKAGPERRRMFDRAAYTDTCWLESP